MEGKKKGKKKEEKRGNIKPGSTRLE